MLAIGFLSFRVRMILLQQMIFFWIALIHLIILIPLYSLQSVCCERFTCPNLIIRPAELEQIWNWFYLCFECFNVTNIHTHHGRKNGILLKNNLKFGYISKNLNFVCSDFFCFFFQLIRFHSKFPLLFSCVKLT